MLKKQKDNCLAQYCKTQLYLRCNFSSLFRQTYSGV